MVGFLETKAKDGLTARLGVRVGERVHLKVAAIRPVDPPSRCATRRLRKRQAQSQ
jgi:hypothetical protein